VSTAAADTSGPRGDYSWVVILALAAFGAIWLLTRNEEGPLSRSAIGHEGLITWAREHNVDIWGSTIGEVQASQIGLRILPLFDTDLTSQFVKPDTQVEYLQTGDENDLSLEVIVEKTRLVRTIVVAPKWTRAMRLSGYAHESLLLDTNDVERPLRQIGNLPTRIARPEDKAITIAPYYGFLDGGTVTLYAPQLFHPDLPENCSSLMGNRSGHLLVDCADKKNSVLALSDPDLIDNHGLNLGDNAQLVLRLLETLSDSKPVIVDYSNRIFLTPDPPLIHKREWSDLLRFFAYPFSLIWLGAAVVTLLAIWRSGVRFGPPREVFADAIGASKAVSIAAKGRLLRLSGNDRELMEAQADNLVQDLASDLLGPHRRADSLRQIISVVARRNPALAAELSAAHAHVMTVRHDAPVSHMLDLLSEFEAKLEKVRHEFGRTSVSG
jgi:hypothetical protein